jgi:hypothetical protein
MGKHWRQPQRSRGEAIMEYLVSLNLKILNWGNEPTFVVNKRKVAIDLKTGTNRISNPVNNWHVSDELSLSNHRYIGFQIGNMIINRTAFGDHKRTNWESYKDDLKLYLETISWSMHMINDRQVCWTIAMGYHYIITILQPMPLAHKGTHLGWIKTWVGWQLKLEGYLI